MRKLVLLSLILLFTIVKTYGQFEYNYYNFQTLYEPAGGFYDTDLLRTIDIHFYDPNFDNILHDGWVNNTNLRLPASISLCNGVSYDSVAIRYKGNSTYAVARDAGMIKLPLNIGMNNIISGQNFYDIRKIKLANAVFDMTFAKEITAYHIFNQYTPSPQANLMKVNLQGDYIGLYVNTESINGRFLRKHFGEDSGVFFKCDPIQQYGQEHDQYYLSNLVWLGNDTTAYYESYELKSDYGWTELRNLIYVINNSPHLIDSILNVDRVLWNFALNTVTLELDKYNGIYQHNYYLYQTKDGRFQMIPWDLDNAFAGTLIAHVPDPDEVYSYDPFGGYTAGPKPLLDRLMENPLYKKIYTAHIRTLLEEVMIEEEVRSFVNDLQDLAYDAAVADTNKLFSMWCFSHNVENVYQIPSIHTGGIMPSVINRKNFLLSHPEIMKTPPEILNVVLFEENETIYAAVEVNNATKLNLRYSFDNHFINLEMYDDGTNGDVTAGDNVYTVALPKPNSGSIVKFYFLAENDEAVVLSPKKAENDYYFFVFSNFEELFINEFMASNSNTIADINDNYEDWIEIYNASSQTIDIAGLFISDNPENLNRHQIPYGYDETKIAPGEFLLLWADGEGTASPLHLSFKLSASEGESVMIYQQETNRVIDSITFGPQATDISYGRYLDGEDNWMLFTQPTPGASNIYNEPPDIISGLYINEFMASNGETIATEFGEYEDWIEIYNSSNQDIDLAGYFITDNLSNFYKYQIPEGFSEVTTIPAGGFLLLWADGEPQLGPLHTSFKLSASGEAVGLMHPDGVTILDSITFGQQIRDISYGRITDGNSDWKFFNTPTPGASNHASNVDDLLSSDNISIYPNPASEYIIIKLPITDNYNIKIIDILGQTIDAFTINSDEITIPINNYKSGMYFMNISNATVDVTKKFVK